MSISGVSHATPYVPPAPAVKTKPVASGDTDHDGGGPDVATPSVQAPTAPAPTSGVGSIISTKA